MSAKIVVGVDGSEQSRLALRWAHAEAALRGAKLEVVHAWLHPSLRTPAVTSPPQQELAAAAQHNLEKIINETLPQNGTAVETRARVEEGPAAIVLLTAARRADLVVVGSRGHAVHGGLRLGSVSQQVADHACCPVVVVR